MAQTIEQVDMHLESTPLVPIPHGATHNICDIYPVAKPILLFAKSLLFFKPTWQSVITGLIAALDNQCNTPTV